MNNVLHDMFNSFQVLLEENSFHRKDFEGEGAEYRTDCDRFIGKKKIRMAELEAEMLKKKSANLEYCAEVWDQSVNCWRLSGGVESRKSRIKEEVFTVQQACELLD